MRCAYRSTHRRSLAIEWVGKRVKEKGSCIAGATIYASLHIGNYTGFFANISFINGTSCSCATSAL